jgi:Fe-S-cluster containining protein
MGFVTIMKNCKGCGKCCSEYYNADKWFDVELHSDDRLRIPEEFQEYRTGGDSSQPQPYWWMKRKNNGSCICFDDTTKLCTIYENRPDICKQFNSTDPRCKE